MTTTVLAECKPNDIGDQPPSQVVGIPECSDFHAFMTRITEWTMWGCAVVCLAALMITLAMIVVDKNQGEAGIAGSVQTKLLKYTLGTAIVSGASALAGALITTV
ncbi:hypothetical protein ACUY2T_09930 [Corynebacterium sp. 22_2729]